MKLYVLFRPLAVALLIVCSIMTAVNLTTGDWQAAKAFCVIALGVLAQLLFFRLHDMLKKWIAE